MATENVTILFTDVARSTELSQGLSVEVADEVRRGHFSILRQAIAEAGGTEVKNLGDGLMVVFASPSAALSCGVVMQQGVDRDNRSREHSVGLRVGISGGEVTVEDGDYFGDPVVEAARLCASCESGQVLAADIVRLMAGRRSRQKCREFGELNLRGLPDPVATVEVLWEPLGDDEAGTGTRIPLPSRLAVRPGVGLVGRGTELLAMGDAAKRVATGEGREIWLVSGESGMGKTTLVAEVARSAFDSGACVLFGHCEEDLATPYQLFAEALGHYVTHAPEDQLLAHVAAHGSELAKLVPAIASRIPELPPSKATDTESERFLLFAAVVGLLAEASADRTVLLVLDDLQWADKGSLVLLRHLADSDLAMRLLVIGTYRDAELSSTHPLLDSLAALRRLNGVTRIELAGLDDLGVLALLEAAAGHTLDEAGVDLAHALYQETDGNPFFVGEVLRHLSETGAICQDASGRWSAGDSSENMTLPDSVREVIGARVGRLGTEAAKVLSMAAVIGRDFDLDVLARATKTSEDDLLDILDGAAAVVLVREMVDTPGRYNFAHALIQHTLYEDLGPTRRARAHRVVVEALEDLCGNRPGDRVGELAHHWLSATQPADLTKAIGYAKQAGDAALAALAPGDALRYYTQALTLCPEVDDSDSGLALELAIGLGTTQRQTGDPAYRETLLTAARRAADLGNSQRLVAAALANHRGFFSAAGIIDRDKVEVLEMALDLLPDNHPDRALILATLCSEVTYGRSLEDRQALADEALAIATSSGDDATMVRVLNLVCEPLRVPATHEQSLARTRDALHRAERVGDPVLLFFAAHWRLHVVAGSGDFDEVDRCLEIEGELVERLDQPMLTWIYTMYRAWRAVIAGETAMLEKLAAQALQIGSTSGQPDAHQIFGAQLTLVSLQRGTMDDLLPLIEQQGVDAPEMAALYRAVAALAHAQGAHPETARPLLEEFALTGFHLPPNPFWLTAMCAYAEAAIAVHNPKYAAPLFDQLGPWADHWGMVGPTTTGPVSHLVGGLAAVLGHYEEAEGYLAQSAAISERIHAKFFAARTDLVWGQILAERHAPGDAEKARELLTKAHTVAAANRYGNVERRAAYALELLDGRRTSL